MTRIDLAPRSRILVIALRRLGDVLLTTPLIRSLRRAWPDATIDALIFADTVDILEGNPDLNGIVTMPVRPTHRQSIALATRLWRKYDLAVSTQSGDRPTRFAIYAGRQRVAPVESTFNGWVKSALLQRSSVAERHLHRIEEILRLADLLGIARVPELVPPQAPDGPALPYRDYAVIHAAPMFRYKQWTKSGWRKVAGALAGQGYSVIATGGPADSERRYLDDLWDGVSVTRLDGRLKWAQLASLLAKARIYVGPDTSVTHLAASTGCPTVAIYGPTNPRLWGPWPAGGLTKNWDVAGEIQQRGNVWLVQNPLPCMPCQLEGCERRLDSHSACLEELSQEIVVMAVERALAERAPSGVAAKT
jgi:heptosyltransferase-3